MNRYLMSNVGNHHFTKRIFEDAQRLMTRYTILATKNNFIPTDAAIMKYFNWSKDHLDRCFQLLKEANVVSYSRNNRRTTLKFLGEYEFLNKCVVK